MSAWLTELRSARTRRACGADLVTWLAGSPSGRPVPWRPGEYMWTCAAASQLDGEATASSPRRRLSALSPFYRSCGYDLIGRVPTDGVARPVVGPDYTATVGLDRD